MLIHQHIRCQKEIARSTFTIVCNCFCENLWAFFCVVASQFTTREINTMLKLGSINISLMMNINWWVNRKKRSSLDFLFHLFASLFIACYIRLFILTYRRMPIGTPNDSPIDHFTILLNETQHRFFLYLSLAPITSYHLNLNRKSLRQRLRFVWGIPKNKRFDSKPTNQLPRREEIFLIKIAWNKAPFYFQMFEEEFISLFQAI